MSLAPLVLALAALAAPAGEPLRIGFYAPLSGASTDIGASARNGARLAVEEINAAGGVLGRPLELVERDDEGNPDKGVAAVTDLVDQAHVVAVIGPGNSGVAEKSGKVANERRVPQIIPVATGNRINELFTDYPDNYLFRLNSPDAIQAKLLVQRAAERHQRIALLCDDTRFGQGGRARVEAAMEGRRMKLAYVGTFKVKEPDMARYVKEAKASGATAVILYALSVDIISILKATRELGWAPEVSSTWNLGSARILEALGSSANGALTLQTFLENGAATDAARRFLERYRGAYPDRPMMQASSAANAYDAVHLLALAIRQAGSTDGPRVKAALEDLRTPYDGAVARFVKPWSPIDHEGIKRQNIVWAVVRDGALVPVAARD